MREFHAEGTEYQKDLGASLPRLAKGRDMGQTLTQTFAVKPLIPSPLRERLWCACPRLPLRLRAHQCHVVKGRQQNSAIHGIEMHEALKFEVHGIVRCGAIFRLGGRTGIPRGNRDASRAREAESAMALATPAVQRSAIGIMRSKASLVRTFVKSGAHGGERKSVPGQSAADAAHIAIFQFLTWRRCCRQLPA